jgi:hypothetical protein
MNPPTPNDPDIVEVSIFTFDERRQGVCVVSIETHKTYYPERPLNAVKVPRAFFEAWKKLVDVYASMEILAVYYACTDPNEKED